MQTLKRLSVPLSFEKQPAQNLLLKVWLFTRDGRYIDQAPVTKNNAEFKTLKDVDADNLRVLITPDFTDQFIKVQTINDLEKFKPYEPVLKWDKNQLVLLPVPSKLADVWLIRFCRVIGLVKKDFVIDGKKVEKPLCKARVHICEVDKIWFWIDRIPDDIILRIPDIVLIPWKPLRPRFPFPPDPGPIFTNFFKPPIFRPLVGPTINPTRNVDFKPMAEVKPNITIRNVQPLAKATIIDSKLKQQLLSKNVLTIKNALLNSFEVFHPYFCNWPWIWPWLYRCDEIKTVYTDFNGRFDTNITYWAGGDKPDVYFWVEYLIDGVWTTVYRPAIPCFTYWDYACGTPITINVTDNRVQAGCNEIIPGEQVWIRAVGSTSIRNIKQDDADITPVQGLPWRRIGLAKTSYINDFMAPFGTSLNLVIKFGSGLPTNNYKFYRWKAIKVANADLSPFSGATTRLLDNSISKPYYVEYIDPWGDPQTMTKSHPLGPVTGTNSLFHIPPASPNGWLGETNATAIWQTADTVSASFDSKSLDGDGLYELTLELFNQSGTEVLTDPTIFKVPRVADSSLTENATAAYLDQHGSIWDFKMLLRIDNSATVSDIYDARVGASPGGPCGFIKYTNPALPQLQLSFKAHHPSGFATFGFNTVKGNNTESCPGDTGGFVFSNTPGYNRSGDGEFVTNPNIKPSAMLGACTKAAFSLNLSVFGLHTNGYTRLHDFDSGDINAFALEP